MDVKTLREDPTLTYLGDGVYAVHDSYQIWLHVSDGVGVLASIALDRNTYQNLRRYATGLAFEE